MGARLLFVPARCPPLSTVPLNLLDALVNAVQFYKDLEPKEKNLKLHDAVAERDPSRRARQ